MRKPIQTLLTLAGLMAASLYSAGAAGAALHGAPNGETLTTVAQIRALSPAQAAQGMPVELHAVITYYDATEGQVFVQDSTGGIFVFMPAHPPRLQAGDAVLLRGKTTPSFDTNLQVSSVRLQGKGQLPKPVAATWTDLMRRGLDCRYATLTGIVRSATRQYANTSDGGATGTGEYLMLDLQMEGGPVLVHMEGVAGVNPEALLNSKVRMEGVAGGIFDGKFQRTGVELWMSSAKYMQVLKPSPTRVADLPLTPISTILSHSYVKDESQQVRVRGSVTFYQPGLQMVVETPRRSSVLVRSYFQSPLRMGQIVDVVGYPDMGQNSEAITDATVLSESKIEPIKPVAVDWDAAMKGQNPYDLVSMVGVVAAQIHEEHQDTLVIRTGTHAFSAVLRRTVWNQNFDRLTLPRYAVGSRVRVTGVCFVHSGGPWNTPLWFELEMNSPGDVVVLAPASWWNVQHLLYVSAALVFLMLGALLWVLLLKSKVRRQAEQIRLRMEDEVARDRRTAMLEKERGKVLEAINVMDDLDAVLRMILHLIASQLEGQACWCELADGKRVGADVPEDGSTVQARRDIFKGTGERLGTLVVAGADAYHSHAGEVMEIGASLIALAIDRQGMYETLVHRSQYDQLTNAANRFLLESRLDEALSQAGRSGGRCGLVYIDLDHFKQINDEYGHRAGDLVLQQVTQRFSDSLRGMDTLARVGGDEFIALVPMIRNRAEVEEIAQRLIRCFDRPFEIDGQSIEGSASIGISVFPDDGLTKDELKRVADTEMYVRKASAAG